MTVENVSEEITDNSTDNIDTSIDPVAVLEARIQSDKDMQSKVPEMAEAYVKELKKLLPLLREWDYPQMEEVIKEPLKVFVDTVSEPAGSSATDTESKPGPVRTPWYARIFGAKTSVQNATSLEVTAPRESITRNVTRLAAVWEVSGLVMLHKNEDFFLIYVDVKDGTPYIKSTRKNLAYELRPDHLHDCTYSQMQTLLQRLDLTARRIESDIKYRKTLEELAAKTPATESQSPNQENQS